jgi:hypothetical protein
MICLNFLRAIVSYILLVEYSVIISQESENKLKIIPQIFENLLPGNRHESPEGSRGYCHLATSLRKNLENYFQFILTLEGYSEDYFFMSTKSKIQKIIILSH